jgi:hypothetical protein
VAYRPCVSHVLHRRCDYSFCRKIYRRRYSLKSPRRKPLRKCKNKMNNKTRFFIQRNGKFFEQLHEKLEIADKTNGAFPVNSRVYFEKCGWCRLTYSDKCDDCSVLQICNDTWKCKFFERPDKKSVIARRLR